MPGTILDLVLILLMIIFAINGYRQGFVVGLLSFVGFFGGAAIGLQLGPLIGNLFSRESARVIVTLIVVFGIALAGQGVANLVGVRIRRSIHNRTGQTLDDVGGAFVSVIALLIVVWLVAAPLASSQISSLSRAIRTSSILRGVNDVMPQAAQALSNELRSTVDTSGFPDVFGGLVPTTVREVPAPNPALAGSPVVRRAAQSVVKIEGSAPSCNRRIEGSGFVYTRDRVLTNAHVVAGTRRVQVLIDGGDRSLAGKVVVYDPRRDLAVIDVPDLGAPALPIASSVARSDADAIVLGYPLDGPYDAEPARVRDVGPIRGPDIYNDATVTRDIYTIRGLVRSGNSGGPLVAPDGDVLGVVFAAAADDPQTGFALTAAEAAPVMNAGRDATDRVSTGACTG
ncbi:MAG TPA: MarP family serine protease [Micromonosporaceae bacterium]